MRPSSAGCCSVSRVRAAWSRGRFALVLCAVVAVEAGLPRMSAADEGPATTEATERAEPERKPVERDRGEERKVKAWIVRAATTDDAEARAAAEALIDEASYVSRYFALAEHSDHGRVAVRRYAWQGLRELGDASSVRVLARRLVKEADRDLRVELTQILRSFDAEGLGTLFLPYLHEKRYQSRFRALQAMGVFPDRRLARRLVEHLSLTVSGFGQAATTFTTQRAYIRGWQIVSGGTGNAVVEVADPEIDVLQTGVSMEVKVRTVEVRMTVELLETLTGQSHGTDAAAWQGWLLDNPDFEVAAARE